MNQTIDTTTSIGTLIIVAALAWWLMVPTAEPVLEPEPVVIEQETGSPGSVFQAGALVREGRALVNRANTTLDRFEREGVIVKPAVPAQQAAASCQQPVYRRPLLRRRR